MQLLEAFSTLFDLLTVVLGFSAIVVIHELGHFVAARWAGIRVLAFAVGFGPALISYRKGIGFRRGSSEDEYHERLGAKLSEHPDRDDHESVRAEVAKTLSPTEYRINALPLGGYVRMLGQEDLNPSAVSSATDSYQSVPVYKRMVVISAGVIFNIITAAIMFVLVFMAGLRVEPPMIGLVNAGSPAELAGLQTGDTILEIDGDTAQRFDDIALAVAMSDPDKSISMLVARPGEPEPFEVEVKPTVAPLTGLLEIGIGPARTLRVIDGGSEEALERFRSVLASEGLEGVEPGMTLATAQAAGEAPVEPIGFADMIPVFANAEASPVTLTFAADDGTSVTVEVAGQPEFDRGLFKLSEGYREFEHVGGLTPVMRVAPETSPAQGLEAGDVFARIDGTDFPSVPRGIYEIRGKRGKPLELRVLRGDDRTSTPLDVRVSRSGQVGFNVDHTGLVDTTLSATPRIFTSVFERAPTPTPADSIDFAPGSSVIEVAGSSVESLGDVRAALQQAIAEAPPGTTVEVEVTIAPFVSGDLDAVSYTQTLVIEPKAAARISALGWTPPFSSSLFEPTQTMLKASNPIEAVGMGLHETKRVLTSTYVTFLRLFQGTVKVEHLKGPVGIAHIGTIIADRGFDWLVFFFALISVNLAVINFLPLPIVDGGQFLMLLYEQIRGKPVPIAIQNGLTLLGLLMIGTVFLIVTFHDVKALLGL
ncbi:MAG: site-2 protease family protein [Planctomycetota bacterium]